MIEIIFSQAPTINLSILDAFSTASWKVKQWYSYNSLHNVKKYIYENTWLSVLTWQKVGLLIPLNSFHNTILKCICYGHVMWKTPWDAAHCSQCCQIGRKIGPKLATLRPTGPHNVTYIPLPIKRLRAPTYPSLSVLVIKMGKTIERRLSEILYIYI